MPTVRTLDRTEVLDVLSLMRAVDPYMDDASWQRLIAPPWVSSRPESGWILMDGDNAVGILAAVFSSRLVDGAERRVCNLSTWYVHPEYRAWSLLLLRAALALKDHTITQLSPNDTVVGVSRRFGFVDLDTGFYYLGPVGGQRGTGNFDSRVDLDDPASATVLSDADRTIFDDHSSIPGCHRVVLQGAEGNCLVVFQTITAGPRPYAHIHYVSVPTVFESGYRLVRRMICRTARSRVIIIDARLAWAAQLPGARPVPNTSTKIYRPAADEFKPFDNLYSELLLLNFSVLPPQLVGRRRRMRSRIARLLPHRTPG